jgi:hypothetical protein
MQREDDERRRARNYRRRQQRNYPQLSLNAEQTLALTNYLLAHQTDIESGINDYGDLRSLMSLIDG